jgi:hypothetical protein
MILAERSELLKKAEDTLYRRLGALLKTQEEVGGIEEGASMYSEYYMDVAKIIRGINEVLMVREKLVEEGRFL